MHTLLLYVPYIELSGTPVYAEQSVVAAVIDQGPEWSSERNTSSAYKSPARRDKSSNEAIGAVFRDWNPYVHPVIINPTPGDKPYLHPP